MFFIFRSDQKTPTINASKLDSEKAKFFKLSSSLSNGSNSPQENNGKKQQLLKPQMQVSKDFLDQLLGSIHHHGTYVRELSLHTFS